MKKLTTIKWDLRDQELDSKWDILEEYQIATREEISLITAINGYNLDTLQDILFVRTGYRTFEQFEEVLKDEE